MSGIHIHSDMMRLLNESDPQVQAYKEIDRRFGIPDYLVVLIRVDKAGKNQEALLRWADRSAEVFTRQPGVVETAYHFTPMQQQALGEFYRQRVLLFLSHEEMEELLRRLSPEMVRQAIADLEWSQYNPIFFMAGFKRNDPLQVVGPVARKNPLANTGFRFKRRAGVILTEDEKAALILLKTGTLASDMPGTQRIIEGLQQRMAGLAAQAAREKLTLSFQLTGRAALALANYQSVRRDMWSTLLCSLVGIFLLFWFFFRSFMATVLSFVPLLAGLAAAGGVAGFLYGELNVLTMIFAAMCAGLGIDFPVHFFARLAHQRQSGSDNPIAATAGHIGRGAVLSAGTTVVALLVLVFSGIRGIRQLGLISAAGVAFCLVATWTLLPALLARWPGLVRSTRLTELRWLWRFFDGSARQRRVVLALAALLLILGPFLGARLRFQQDFTAVNSRRGGALEAMLELQKSIRGGLSPLIFTFRAASPEEGLRRLWRLHPELESLRQDGKVALVESLSNYLPPREQQQARLNELQAYRRRGQEFRRTYSRALAKSPLAADPYLKEVYPALIEQGLQNRQGIDFSDLKRLGLNAAISKYLRPAEGGGYDLAFYLYLPQEHPEPAQVRQVLQLVQRAAGETLLVSGGPVLAGHWKEAIRRELTWLSLLAAVLVLLLLIAAYRSPWLAGAVLLPAGLGISLVLVAMWLAGHRINLFNMAALPMIIGMGIDYQIYFANRLLAGDSLQDTFSGTGNAILVTALTTAVGYGSFALAGFRGLRYLAFTGGWGIMFCWFGAVFFLPTFILLIKKRTC